MILFLLTLVMAVLHLLGVGHAEHHGHASPLTAVDVWITFLAIILPVWGAAIHAIINQLELDRIGSRSAQMATLLGDLVQRAHEAETIEELRDVIREAEQVMSLETHDWWILVSFREPVLPA